MISIQKLTKSYGQKQVLNEINLDLEAGKVYGLIGQNGAGKTTFFRCLSGLEKFGGDIVSDHPNLKDKLGFLQTNPDFMSRITGWEYLKLVSIARGIQEEGFEEGNIFDLPLNEFAENYSTGMKKKLALQGILCQRNDLFLLDEPFNGVDIHSNMIISAIITKLKNHGKTIVISSHIFSTLSDICDQIILLKDGLISGIFEPSQFAGLEQEMKSFVIGNVLDRVKV